MTARHSGSTRTSQAEALRTAVSEPADRPEPASRRSSVPEVELRAQISEAAYYRAQQRGFSPGFELDDWIAAEAEVTKRLGLDGPPRAKT